MITLDFGVCKNCGHEIVFFDGQWKHHTTRTKLHHVPHWPTGHVITLECKQNCQCSEPHLDESMGKKSKIALVGRHPDKYRITFTKLGKGR